MAGDNIFPGAPCTLPYALDDCGGRLMDRSASTFSIFSAARSRPSFAAWLDDLEIQRAENALRSE